MGLLTLLSFGFFAFFPLPRAYYPELVLGRPQELAASVFFLAALVGYLRKGVWKRDGFEHWLVLSLIVGFMGQTMFMPFSFQLFDTLFDIAHLLKMVSYVCVLTGLIVSMYQLFQQLEERTAKINRIYELSGDMLGTIGADGFFKELNPSWEATLGYTRDELLGQLFTNFLHPEDRADVLAMLSQLTEGGGVKTLENRFRAQDGVYRWLSWNTFMSLDENQLYFVIRDVTEQKQNAEKLTASEERFRTLLEGASVAAVIIDRAGDIVLINAQTEALFGYGRDEIVGQPLEILIPERFRKNHVSHRQGYFDNPRVRSMGTELNLMGKRKDESTFPIEVGLSFVHTDDQMLAVGFITDISERKAAEQALHERSQELARSNADLEQFVYVASHDLKEPLRAVGSYMQLLERRYKAELDERAQKYINYAVEGATRMQQLIDDLLTYSRAGRDDQAFETVDCAALIAQVLDSLQIIIQENKAVITSDDLPNVQGDASQLAQLFQNLITNGIKFQTDTQPPHIHISARQNDDKAWVFGVQDNGIGIAADYVERIFVIFQRLHLREEYPGTGIGLAICKKIVDRHQGDIWVESQPGDGATFYFTIPAQGGNNDGKTH